MTDLPCAVTQDLNRYMDEQDKAEAKGEAIQEWATEDQRLDIVAELLADDPMYLLDDHSPDYSIIETVISEPGMLDALAGGSANPEATMQAAMMIFEKYRHAFASWMMSEEFDEHVAKAWEKEFEE